MCQRTRRRVDCEMSIIILCRCRQSWPKVRVSTNEAFTSTRVRCRLSCILAHSSGTTLPNHYSACVTTPYPTSGCGCVGCCHASIGLCGLRTKLCVSCWKTACIDCVQVRRTVTSSRNGERYNYHKNKETNNNY